MLTATASPARPGSEPLENRGRLPVAAHGRAVAALAAAGARREVAPCNVAAV